MTDWASLNVFRDILINYYFGDPVMYYSSICLFFLIALTVAGLDVRISIVFMLPLVGAFSIAGLFGGNTFVLPIILTLMAVIYAYTIIDLFT